MWNITCEHCKKIFLERNKGNIKIKLPESSGVLKMTKADAMYLVKKWEERWEKLREIINKEYDAGSMRSCGTCDGLLLVKKIMKDLEEL
jgi:phage FluMu protein Com